MHAAARALVVAFLAFALFSCGGSAAPTGSSNSPAGGSGGGGSPSPAPAAGVAKIDTVFNTFAVVHAARLVIGFTAGSMGADYHVHRVVDSGFERKPAAKGQLPRGAIDVLASPRGDWLLIKTVGDGNVRLAPFDAATMKIGAFVGGPVDGAFGEVRGGNALRPFAVWVSDTEFVVAGSTPHLCTVSPPGLVRPFDAAQPEGLALLRHGNAAVVGGGSGLTLLDFGASFRTTAAEPPPSQTRTLVTVPGGSFGHAGVSCVSRDGRAIAFRTRDALFACTFDPAAQTAGVPAQLCELESTSTREELVDADPTGQRLFVSHRKWLAVFERRGDGFAPLGEKRDLKATAHGLTAIDADRAVYNDLENGGLLLVDVRSR